MGLFSFFSKKEASPGAHIIDKVWIHEAGKINGCMQLLQQFPGAVLLAWFPESQRHWESLFNQNGISLQVTLARNTSGIQLTGKTIILLEHYPIASREATFFQSLQQQAIYVLSSMDEPLFTLFGGERIIDLMRKMGMSEDEAVEHKLITQSLQNAQRKLEKKVTLEQSAHSMKEWFAKNTSQNG